METQVLVIGGGATGLGVAWDLTLRGVEVVLVEMGEAATGTTGRNHGLLHSGGRYAVKDPESARECIEENNILRRILPAAFDNAGGLFVLTPDDDEGYVEDWVEGCRQAGIPFEEINPQTALKREPLLNPNIRMAYGAPDSHADTSVLANTIQSACEARGATFLSFHRVDGFERKNDRIQSVQVRDLRTGAQKEIKALMVVNATGPWSAQVAALAGVQYTMSLSRGAMIGFNGRWVNTVINRLRKPGDGDIIVPWPRMAVAGTTSTPTEKPDDTMIEPRESDVILEEAAVLLPGIREATIMRSWAGVRPIYDPEANVRSGGEAPAEGRESSRTFAVLDHTREHGLSGMVTITGGKLTTFRLMAEKTSDLVCEKLGIQAACRTADIEIR
jgi:glycerol-3-phosphate dehydrogenase